jgi:hypothetical protein
VTGGSTLHYRCVFDISPAGPDLPWSDLPRLVHSWISAKTGDVALEPERFVQGGRAEARHRRIAVGTGREIGTGTLEAPQLWSARFDHPCSEVAFRQWRTDIGLTRVGDNVRFSLLTRHWIRDGYIGEEPPPPVPSAPGIVGRVLRARAWQSFAGPQRLWDHPVELSAGQGASLRQMLEDPQRVATVVLVTRRFGTELTLVDSAKLARLLAGVAVVLEATRAEVNKEIEWVLPKGFRCWDGMVRAYLPGVHFDSEGDARRHRYFSSDQIAELTPQIVEDRLITGIARRSALQVGDAVTTLEDVSAKQREYRLAELRQAVDDTSVKEYVELLEGDVKGLAATIASKDQDLAFAAERNDGLSEQVDELEEQAAKMLHERDHWKAQALKATERFEKRSRALDSLRRLPEDLLSALDLLEALHGGTLVFSERARKAAAKVRTYEVQEVWQCLWAMATILRELFFNQSVPLDVEDAFRNRTGFRLALSESSETKKDKSLMRLRKDTFEGKEIDITPHVKVGATFRIYFAVDRDAQRLIVGHCGEHLDTAGTRRMS